MIKEFKKNIRGAYELHINNKATGFSFFIPNGFKIDDYADKIEYIQPQGAYLSANVCFKITSSPNQFGRAYIDSNTSLTFKDGLVINVSKNIYLSHNDNVVLEPKSETKTLSFDDFRLAHNQGTHFCFNGDIVNTERKSKNESEKLFDARNNGEGLFNLRDDLEKFELMNNTILKLYAIDPILGDINSVDFDSKNVSCTYGQFCFGDAKSRVAFSSDEIEIKESYLEVKNGKTIITQTGKDFSILVMIEAQFLGGLTRLFTKDTLSSSWSSDEAHSLVTNSSRLHFNPNSSTSILYDNKIVSEGDIAFSRNKSNALANISLDFEGKGAELGKNEIINTTISFFSENKKSKSSKYLLTENTLVDVEVKNLMASKIQKWSVRDLKATDITSQPNASLLTDGVKLEAQNLVLEKGSSLSLIVNSRKDWQCSLSNSIIKGQNTLQGSEEINIKNSILENAVFLNKNEGRQKLVVSESSLKGNSSVKNIKEITRSSICDSNLTANGEPKTISDDFLNQVNNLDAFLKAKESPCRQDANSNLELL